MVGDGESDEFVRESLDAERVSFRVSSACFTTHSCLSASFAMILLAGSGWSIFVTRSWAEGEMLSSGGNSSAALEWALASVDTDKSSPESSSCSLNKTW